MAKPDPLEQLVPVPADMVGPITESLAGHVLVLLNSEIQNMGDRPGELTAASVYKVLKDFEMVFLDNLKSGASKTSPGEKDNSVSAALRRAFDKLRSDVMELPWDKLFSEQQVKKFVKRYDGFQQHLVSPELALRALIKDALDTVKPMALDLVNRAHSMLLESARLSAIDAQYVGMGQRSVRGSAVGRVSRFPMLENEMMPVITRTLESYRQTSAELAETLVDMERDCVTVSFFRKLQFSRLQRAVILIERDELGAGAGDESVVSANRQDDDEAASDDGSDDGSAVSVQISPELEALNTPEKLQRQSLRKQPGFFDPLTKIKREDWREDRSPRGWMLGILRKRAHETGRFRSDKARWQQRYFAYSDDTHELYYWKNIPASDERARADLGSAQVYIPNCIVKQVNASEAEGAPEGQASQLPRVFSVTSKINGGIINRKGHRKMYLMAASGGTMFQWTARLSNSSTAPTRQGSGASVGDDSPTAGKVNPLKRPTLEVETGGEAEEGGEGGDVMDDPSLPRTPTGSYHMGDLGLGSPFFDSEELKREGRLRPAPVSMLRPAKDIAAGKGMFYKVLDEEGNLREKERGEMVVQMGQDAKTYSMAICDSLHTNLPKVIMYEQVERAEKELASSLQGEFLGLSKDRQNQLLQEDPMMESRRAMAVHCREELHDLLDKLRDPAQPQDEKDRESSIRRVPAKALVLAGLTNHPTFPPAIKGHATAKQLVEAMYGKMSPQAILQAAAGPADSLRYYLDESRRQQRRAAKASSAAEGGAPPNDRPPPHPEAAARGTPPPGSQPQRRASSGPGRGPPMVPQASGPSMSRRPAPVAPPNLSRTSATGSFSAPQRSAPSRPNQH